MKTAIIHISDLHVSTYIGNDGRLAKRINSFLTTNEDETDSNLFIQTFIERVKSDYPGHHKLLLISGDISNIAEPKEFEFASKFIGKICEGLNISKNEILMLPGDHDVHRRSIENEIALRPNKNPHLLNHIKFSNFARFYEDVLGKAFQFDRLIVDHLLVQDKIVLVGLNSNGKIDNEGGDGYIDVDRFRSEMDELKEKFSTPEIQYVCCWHHNFASNFENKNNGQWEPENRRYLLSELESQNVKLVLTGNEHTSGSKDLLGGSIQTSDCGTLTSNSFDATYKVYVVNSDSIVFLENNIFALQKTNNNDKLYFWDKRDNKAAKQPASFELFVQNTQIIKEEIALPESLSSDTETASDVVDLPTIRRFYQNPSISDNLYETIRRKKLFHSGHFHWSATSRAHNWIDIAKLLEDYQDLIFVQNAIIDVINQFELHKDCGLIIGLGYEGNIISSKVSLKYDIPYSSLPYSYRYNDHHDYEKKLNFDNRKSLIKKVIIITDVVNDGRTIRKLIAKREADFFSNVAEINVVSLFYTGQNEINTDILNHNNLPNGYDLDNDHQVNNINFYTVKSLRIEKCPYGHDYAQECLIYKDELSCVHLFYDEGEGEKK